MTDRFSDDYSTESTLPAVLWIIPVLVAVVLPGLIWVVAERPMATRVSLALAMSAAVGIIALIVLAVLSKGFNQPIRWSSGLTAVIILTLFQWPIVTSTGRFVARALHLSILLDAMPVLIAVGFLWIATRLAGEWPFAVLLGVSLLVAGGLLLSSALSRVVSTPVTASSEQAAPGAPDVILLILDGYTRADILTERFSFDNTPFLEELEQLGFTIAGEARANYNYTYASISTMLELDYVFNVGEINEADHQRMRNALSGDPTLLRIFHEAGYEIGYTENYWSGSHCGGAVDICWRDGLAERALWNLGRMTLFAPLLPEIRSHPFNTVSLGHLESLPDLMDEGRSDGVPRLAIVHIVLPHQPFLLDAQCNQQIGGMRNSLTISNIEFVEPRRGYYVDQIACTNSKILEALAAIVTSRSDTLVMVTADHGSDSTRVAGVSGDWSDEEIAERMSILGAYRLPDCADGIYESITPVNGIRAITNCALGTDLSALPDKHLWVRQDWIGSVTDIAWRLDG